MTDPTQSVGRRSWHIAICPKCGMAKIVEDEWVHGRDSIHFLPDTCDGAGGEPEFVVAVET